MLRSLLAYARGAGIDARWIVRTAIPPSSRSQAPAQLAPRRRRRRRPARRGRARPLRGGHRGRRRSAAGASGPGRHGHPPRSPDRRDGAAPRARRACPSCGGCTSAQTGTVIWPRSPAPSCSRTSRAVGSLRRVSPRASPGPSSIRACRRRDAVDRRVLAEEPDAGGRRRGRHPPGRRTRSRDRSPPRPRSSARTAAAALGGTVGHRCPGRTGRPWTGRFVAQVSRWDRLKDPLGVLHGFARYRRQLGWRASAAGRAAGGARSPTTLRRTPRPRGGGRGTARALPASVARPRAPRDAARSTTRTRTLRSSTRSSGARPWWSRSRSPRASG